MHLCSAPTPSHLTPDTADRCLQELLREPAPDWQALRPWLFTPGKQQEEVASWVLSRLAGVHMYWSLASGAGDITRWRLDFLPAGSLPSPSRAMVLELMDRRLSPPGPDATLQIVGHMSDWLRCGTGLPRLVQRNGYALLGRMSQAMLPGDRAAESRLLREELVFRYTHATPLPLQQDLLQHLTGYWLAGLRPGSRMPDEELFYGLFFLRQEAARISPLRPLAGDHYLRLTETVRCFRPELAASVPHQEDYNVAADIGWSSLSCLRESGLTGLLKVLEQKRRSWDPTPLLSRLLELKPDYIETQKEEWRRVISSLVDWSCLPEVVQHYPLARLEVSHFIGRIQSAGLVPDECVRWLGQLAPSSPSPAASRSCIMKSLPNITF